MSRRWPYSFSQALTWALYSIAAVFFSARIFIRLKLNKHLELDDGLVAFSMIMFTALSILQTAYVDTTFEVQFVRTDHRPAPAGFEEASSRFAQYQWAIAYFFFTGIWAVKGSFLAFYEKLTQRLPRIRRAWWIGIVFTFLTYIGSLLAYAFLNGLKFKKSLRNKAINYQFAADFTTDIISKSQITFRASTNILVRLRFDSFSSYRHPSHARPSKFYPLSTKTPPLPHLRHDLRHHHLLPHPLRRQPP